MQGIQKVIERNERNKQKKLWLETDPTKKPSEELVIETLKAMEVKKAETLSELSNPFKVSREKYETVIDLECAKWRLTHFVEVDQGISSERLFWAACHHYNLMKSQEELEDPEREGLSRDAEVIKNNAI